MTEQASPPAGPAVDSRGVPVVDPTRNVVALVIAAERRLDDLREMDSRHTRELMAMGERHAEQLRLAESARIDAILAANQDSVTRANAVAVAQAEALRNQVEQARITTAEAWITALQPIQKDVSELRQGQFQQQGERASHVEQRGSSQWLWGFGISAFVALISLVTLIVFIASHR